MTASRTRDAKHNDSGPVIFDSKKKIHLAKKKKFFGG